MAPLARSILVTGSNRGIGLELIQQLVKMAEPPELIFATCRTPAGPGGKILNELASKHSNIHIIQLEVEDQSSVKAAASVVESLLHGKGLNLLINNAGVNSYATLETVEQQEMLSAFNTNVVGPILVVKEFLPLLKKAAGEATIKEMSCQRAAIINITSKLASIEQGFEVMKGPMYPYRASKAPVTVQNSVRGILNVLANLSSASNGAFLDWEGKRLPWCITFPVGVTQPKQMEVLNPRSVLVTGSNRGIGLELVKQLVEKSNPPEWIFATCRDPEGPRAKSLKNLAAQHQHRIEIIQLDTSDPSSIQAAAATITERLHGAGLNLLFNNAGIVKPSTVESETPENMSEVFLPLLKKASQESVLKGMSCSKAAIVNISSDCGSISNVLGWDIGQNLSMALLNRWSPAYPAIASVKAETSRQR
ncbi:hypothetical protein Chor_013373 [Crotalus horridus]